MIPVQLILAWILAVIVHCIFLALSAWIGIPLVWIFISVVTPEEEVILTPDLDDPYHELIDEEEGNSDGSSPIPSSSSTSPLFGED
jgi:ABC-type glycerol-3-phosphate transport system permease component